MLPVTLQSYVLNDREIADLFANGAISPAPDRGQIQPASVDLRLGKRAWRLPYSFLPLKQSIQDMVDDVAVEAFDLVAPVRIDPGSVVLFEVEESLKLPFDVSARANPKSSTGRVDVLVRLIADCPHGFDTIPPGYCGRLYLEVCPASFPIVVSRGTRLSQIRMRRGCPRVDDEDLATAHLQSPLVDDGLIIDNGLWLSVDLQPLSLCGWVSERTDLPVDMDKPGSRQIADYFRAVHADARGRVVLHPDAFYILATREAVRIPDTMAAEMLPYDPAAGEFRSHYAGFADPGFGKVRSQLVLEIRSYGMPFLLEHGQRIGRLLFEPLNEVPAALYGENHGSNNYQGQRGPRVAKYFIP